MQNEVGTLTHAATNGTYRGLCLWILWFWVYAVCMKHRPKDLDLRLSAPTHFNDQPLSKRSSVLFALLFFGWCLF